MAAYYRFIQKKHAASPFGYGLGGARWHPRGVPMIYAGSSVAIITAEFLSINGGTVLKAAWVLITYAVANAPPHLETTSLPSDWDSRPYALSTQEFGRNWARGNTSVCLKIPSARITLAAYPREHNLLINPLHPDLLNEVRVTSIEDQFFHLNEWATGHR